ncbi:hypothetical protein [Endozoicomonas atrinae]|uniref:hypothetical protein n=1 Tax=Endozoicomonas atrinae TaxID=1333660 RepID=UPI003B00CE05
MAVAVSTQLAVPTQPAAPSQLGLRGPVDQTANASRSVIEKEKNTYAFDSFGNLKQVREVERWELRTVHDPNFGERRFVKALGRQIIERNIASNPQTTCVCIAQPTPPIVVSPGPVIRNAAYPANVVPAAWRALPDRSIVSFSPMPHAMYVFVVRPDLLETPSARIVIEVISKVAQLVALLSGGSVQLIDSKQEKPDGHSTLQEGCFYLSQSHSISGLLCDLINNLRLQGHPEDIQKAVDLPRLEEKLSFALNDPALLSDPSLLQELDSLINQYSIVAEQKGLSINRQCHSELLKPGVVNAFNTGVENDGVSLSAKPGLNNGRGEHEVKNGERSVPSGKNSAHEVGRAESGNKAGINTNINNSAMPVSSNQVIGPLNQLLAATGLANIVAQPLIAAESGPKQLPPIILPNANPGSRSDKRRKSRKELKEEEEKEREGEGGGGGFIFDDEPFDPFSE